MGTLIQNRGVLFWISLKQRLSDPLQKQTDLLWFEQDYGAKIPNRVLLLIFGVVLLFYALGNFISSECTETREVFNSKKCDHAQNAEAKAKAEGVAIPDDFEKRFEQFEKNYSTKKG